MGVSVAEFQRNGFFLLLLHNGNSKAAQHSGCDMTVARSLTQIYGESKERDVETLNGPREGV